MVLLRWTDNLNGTLKMDRVDAVGDDDLFNTKNVEEIVHSHPYKYIRKYHPSNDGRYSYGFGMQIPSEKDKTYYNIVQSRLTNPNGSATTTTMPKMSIFHPSTYDENLFKFTHEFNANGALGHEGLVADGFKDSPYSRAVDRALKKKYSEW